MAGRAHSRTVRELDRLRLEEARALPTEPRDAAIPYTPDLCFEVVSLASIGLAPAEIAAHWAIAEDELREWEDAHPDFEVASRRARTRAKAWWQRQPRLAIAEGNNKFPAGAWAQQVRALFPEYDDKAPPITIVLNLVHVTRGEDETGLPDERTVGGVKRLKALKAVRLDASHTASGDLQNDALSLGGPSAGDPGNAGPDKA